MDYAAHQSSASHFEYVVDRRESVHSLKQQALWYMGFLHGWCSLQKADFLIDLVLQTKPEKIVEVGVWGGKSLVPMAYALKNNQSGIIYGIDPWDNAASLEHMHDPGSQMFWRWADHGEVYRGLVRKIEEFDLVKQVELIATTSEGAPDIADIDLLHIDGNHAEETSFFDVQKWVPLVKKGGIIIFDDMTWFENGKYTTEKAVRWLDEHCFKLAEFTDVCVWGVWVKL
jgi:predicted O-methyltransferase YrrM